MSYGKHKVEHIIQGMYGVGKNTLTVGTGGRFPTIQAAITYAETLGAFTPIASSFNTQGSVASWAQHASTFSPDVIVNTDFGGSYKFVTPVSTDKIWFKVADDAYYYPLEEHKGVSAGVAALQGFSTIRRIEASVATTKAITWYKQNDIVIYLLDAYTDETFTISSNLCVTFMGNGRNVLNTIITQGAGFVSGKLTFSNIIVSARTSNGAIAWATNNTIMLEFIGCEISSVHDDFIFPTTVLGGVRAERCTITQQPTGEQGHVLSPGEVRGDIVVQDVVWRPTNHSSSFVVVNNCFLVDVDTSCRNVIINGVTGFVRDKSAQFREVAIFGSAARTQTVSGEVIITNCRLVTPDAMAASSTLTIVQLNANSAASEIHIDNCSISAPNTAGAIKLVDCAATITGAVAVKVGRGNSNLKGDLQTNLTYTMTASANSGTATITAAATSIAVTHSLGYAPNIADIRIVPTLLSSAVKWWVSAVSATTFTITVDQVPGAGTATFAWSIGI